VQRFALAAKQSCTMQRDYLHQTVRAPRRALLYARELKALQSSVLLR
jgi:hypothetical protein